MENNMLADNCASNDSIISNDEIFSVYDFVCLFVAIKRIYGSSLFSSHILCDFINKIKSQGRLNKLLSCLGDDSDVLLDTVNKLIFEGYLDYANTSFNENDYVLFEATKEFPTRKILNKEKKYHEEMTIFVAGFITYQNEVLIDKTTNKKKSKIKG